MADLAFDIEASAVKVAAILSRTRASRRSRAGKGGA
jgi:hypothetical protein